MSVFIHPQALCESQKIGANSHIWAFAHVLSGAVIGRDCNICDHVFIENDVIIGDRVTIKSGVQLWDGLRIENDVFIGPNATFTNDSFPRSKSHLAVYPQTVVQAGASIGANATILPGLTIGSKAMIGAGTVITRNVPPGAIVVGNPGRIIGYEGTSPISTEIAPGPNTSIRPAQVRGVSLYKLPSFRDLRGSLSVAEFERDLPFIPQRFFMVYAVPGKDVRGEHAHRHCHQFLICCVGSVHVVADDGQQRQEFILNTPELGLYLPPMIWGTQYKYSDDAVLLVLASHAYDPNDYIRDYAEFLRLADVHKA